MRNVKRMLALTLSLVLTLSLSANALAYSGTDVRPVNEVVSTSLSEDDSLMTALSGFMDSVRAMFVNPAAEGDDVTGGDNTPQEPTETPDGGENFDETPDNGDATPDDGNEVPGDGDEAPGDGDETPDVTPDTSATFTPANAGAETEPATGSLVEMVKLAGETEGVIVLNEDVVLEEALRIPTGKFVIDINGHTISRELDTAAELGSVIDVSGELIIKNSSETMGTIKGGNTTSIGGGIYVSSTGKLTLEKTLVTGNAANIGGGIYGAGSVTLIDSSVTGNTAVMFGGGVWVDSTLSVSGKVMVSENTADAKADNVYLSYGKTVSVDKALTAGSYIGVRTEAEPTASAPIAIVSGVNGYALSEADVAAIHADDMLFVLDTVNGSVVLGQTPKYIATIRFVTDDETPVAIATEYQTDELTSLTYDLNDAIPETILYNGHNYQLVDIDGYTDGVIASHCTVTAKYSVDDMGNAKDMRKPDGVPDKYQVVVRFVAINGSLDFYMTVLTRRDATGALDMDSNAVLANVPGAYANTGYGDGKWDVVPYINMGISHDTTFTVTFVKDGASTEVPGDDEKPIVLDTMPLIEREKHMSFIAGYGDGKFGPTDKITRAQISAMLFRLFKDEAVSEYYKPNSYFKDVPENAWYESYVATLANAGVVSGYDEYRFGPNDNVTRAEFVTMLVRLLDKKTTSDERIDKVFTDVKADAWYSESVQTAYSMGWIHGYEDHRFGPNDNLTRAEAVVILNRVLGREAHEGYMISNMPTFTDVKADAWYFLDVQEAANGHTYVRSEANGFEIWRSLL